MDEDQTRPSRRRLAVVIAAAVLVLTGVVVGTLKARSNEPVRSVAATCADLEQAKDLDRALASLDPATLTERLGALQRAARAAPPDIAPQVSRLSGFIEGLIDQVEQRPAAQRRQELADAIAQRSAEIDAITAAGDALQEWARTNCGFELGDSTSPSLP